eukprot:PITA_03789
MNKVPEEAWSGRKQGVTHMKAFGCVAYAHIPDQLRKKFDSKGEKCIFIRYSEESKAYRLYNPSTKKFFVSRDVQFIEEEAWDGSIERTVNVKSSLSHDEDDQEITEIHPQTAAPTQGQQETPLRRNENASSSTSQGGNSSASSSACTPNERYAIKDRKWIEAMDEEINTIERNKTWDLVELPKVKEVIGVKWVYKTKSNVEGKIERHNARLVVKRYKQQYGRDYEEMFAPVARMETMRAVLSIAAQNKWKVYQMDVKSAFLNGVLMEEVYIEQPAGYEKKGQKHKVCRLKKALYGLKQAPRVWYSRIDSYLLENRFEKCEGEPTLYIKEKDGNILIVVLYVDDVIFTRNDNYLIENFKTVMKEEFEMTDMGLLRYFLGIEVEQNGNEIFISQAKYADEVLERFNMQESKAAITPTVMGLKLSKEDNNKDFDPSLYKSIVGNVMYLTATRPDIMHVVILISRFMERPKEAHCDWAGSVNDQKSTSGYVFHMGSGAISWASKKQPIVALFTAEAEYVAATAAACQAVWMRRMLRSLCQKQAKGTVIFCDNSSAIALSNNFVFHKRTKHIDTNFHYIRELVNNGEIVLQHCRTQEQVADILTKPLDQKSFEFLRKCLGIIDNPVVEIKGEC